MGTSVGILAQAIQTAYQPQIHLVLFPGVATQVPITKGVTQVRLWGIAPGGPGGGGKTNGGGGGGGSSGEAVGTVAAGKLYNLPATTVAVEFFNGLLGTPGRANAATANDGADAGNSTAYAVLANGSKVLLQSLRGGARGKTAVSTTGGNGANSPNGEMTGGTGSSTVGTRGNNGNYPGDIASYISAGGVIPGSSGGGGGFYEATRSNASAGTGGYGGAADAVNGNSGVGPQGENGGADGGAGGNNPGFPWCAGYNGTAASYKATNFKNPINTAMGSGGSGGPSGQPGFKGGLGCWRMQEVAGANPPGAWQGAERLYNGPKVFPVSFIRTVEPGWPGPAGGFGTSYSAPAYASVIGGLRQFGWEDGQGRLSGGASISSAGAWPSVMSDPANPLWTWYDARMAAVSGLGLKLTMSFFGTPTVLSTNPSDVTHPYRGYPPANLSDLYNFVVTFLNRYGGYGTIDAIELWNEPGTAADFWMGTASQAVDVWYTIKAAAKSVDSRFRIIFPGWLDSNDTTNSMRAFMNAYGTVNSTVQGWQIFDSYGAHPYNTLPNETRGQTGGVNNSMFLNGDACIAQAMEEVISHGGTWGGFDCTEVGMSAVVPPMTDAGVRGLHMFGCFINAFCLGANTYSLFQPKSGFDPNAGQKWWGNFGEADLAKVGAWVKKNIAGYSLASVKEQITGTDQVWRITRSDGATYMVDKFTFV